MTDETSSTTAVDDQTSAAHQNPDPRATQAREHDRAQESWFDRLLAAVGLRGGEESLRENLVSALADEGSAHDLFSAEERRLLQNILRVRDLRVEDVMVPRADIDAVEETLTVAEILRVFSDAGHSRLPVYRATLDDPQGFVHVKDVVAYICGDASARKGNGNGNGNDGASVSGANGSTNVAGGGPAAGDGRVTGPSAGDGGARAVDVTAADITRPIAGLGLIRPILFVPPSMPALDLMVRMRAARVQLALVIDEYGGTDGLVSLEDLVETVVGDIEDEHDEADEPMFQAAGENAWVVDARLLIEDFEKLTGLALEAGDSREYVDTMGGLVFALLGRVPVRGELISSDALPGFEFEVLDADPRRLRRLKLYRRQSGGARRSSGPGLQRPQDTSAAA